MDLESVTDELYGLPPGDFTSARNARAKQARTDGDRDLAAEIQALAKPTTSAWLLNRLARELDEELEPLIDLGRDLREATSNLSGDQLRALTRQRHEVVHALVQQARRLGASRGTKVSESVASEVQQTLDATLADPGVAKAVLAGRLTQAVEYAGFGEPAGVAWAGTSQRPAKRPVRKPAKGAGASVSDLAARRRASAESARDEAAAQLRAAQDDHEAAVRESEQAASALQTMERDVDRLRTELEEAKVQARAAARSERTARDQVHRADRAVRAAEQARQQAAEHLASLER